MSNLKKLLSENGGGQIGRSDAFHLSSVNVSRTSRSASANFLRDGSRTNASVSTLRWQKCVSATIDKSYLRVNCHAEKATVANFVFANVGGELTFSLRFSPRRSRTASLDRVVVLVLVLK